MVGLVVISFFGVVVKMGTAGNLAWGEIAQGFISNLSLLNSNRMKFI
jgi:hypothetical protein